MRRALIIAAAVAAAAVPASTAGAQGCEDCAELDVQQTLHQACHFVADRMGWHCIEGVQLSNTRQMDCIQVWLGRPGCLTDFIPKPG